ncbi:MAG TPA: LysR substrate-binding domain-containing protein, partial [Hyphomicrobium sp.]|nr:LysR substrate-binding domain-containing protein [Hyphomicrobium sp.]
ARVGTRLLNRTTREVSPTHDGAAFYDRCARLLLDVEETEMLFRRSAALPSGKLRVDVPGRIGRLIIAPALPDFLDQFPDIQIELGATDRAVNMVQENIDCVLRVGTLRDSGLIGRSIGELKLLNVASPRYIKRYGKPRTPDHLSEHWAVNYASPSTGRIEAWEWVEDGKVHTRSMRSRVTVNSAEAYIACCIAGVGLIQIPAYDVRDSLASGALVKVMPKHHAAPLPITLLYPRRQHLSRRLQVFVDWMEALLKRDVLG